MIVTFTISDKLSAALTEKLGNPSRAALEALAAEAYEQNALSLEQVRRLLALESRWQTQEVLSRHGVLHPWQPRSAPPATDRVVRLKN